MPTFTGSLSQHPARVSFAWYLAVIAIGTVLLVQPFCRAPAAAPITLLDAAFTATSATCVTGLAVRSTSGDFSFAGQVVLLLLVQLGGVGIMTVTTFLTLQLGGRAGLRQRTVLAETLGTADEPDLRHVLRLVLRATFAFEAAGALLLFARFAVDRAWPTALWHAIFHSVSAFCNAGFALYDDSLTQFQGDWLVNPVLILLIVCGGIGFPVMLDVGRNLHGPWSDRWQRLMLHTKIMLIGTLSLLLLGVVGFLMLEDQGVLQDMSWPCKLLVSCFYSATCRTAGFNTVEMGVLTNATLFLTIILMMIGAGPCSTGGGFKVSTFVVLSLRGWATFCGQRRVRVFKRTIPEDATDRATATALLFAVVALVALLVLLICEQSRTPHAMSQGLFLDGVFELISALGTVGLSIGMTPHLSDAGRMIIIMLMFFGRLGPISVFAALSHGTDKRAFEYAEEEPLIG